MLLRRTVGSLKGYKTLWEKEKLLVTSNFSFFHSVYQRPVPQTRKNQGLFGKGLTVEPISLAEKDLMIVCPSPKRFTKYFRASKILKKELLLKTFWGGGGEREK